MKKFLLTFFMFVTVSLGHAQANLETDPNVPTGYVKATNPYYFASMDGVLYVFSGSDPFILVRYPVADERSSFTIPNTVTRIARGAFKGCKNLETLIIPSSVFYIGDNAFDDTEIANFTVMGNNFGEMKAVGADSSIEEGYYDVLGRNATNLSNGIQIVAGDGPARKILKK